MANKYLFTILIIISTASTISAFRLPNHIKPEHYDITIITHLNGDDKNFTFNGTSKIQLKIQQNTKRIILHSKDLHINEKKIYIKSLDDINTVRVLNVSYDKSVDFLIIDVDVYLKAWFHYEINIPFQGLLLNNLAGFYRTRYKNMETGEYEWMAVTQFEPTKARAAFPCFDEPSFKAEFTISIGRKEGLKSISNMPLITSIPIDGKKGWYLDKFERSHYMSTYLVAFMVSNFEYVKTKTNSNVTIKIWSRKGAIDKTQYASEISRKVLEYFEKYFNEPYPLLKHDLIAVPSLYPIAMENWGISTYRENILLLNSNASSTIKKCNTATIIAHEMAHQWFGNLVTMKWWTDLWLNEGFATYVSTLAVDHIYPEWKIHEKEVARTYLRVFKADLLQTNHPLSIEIEDNKQIDEIFDPISYNKGTAIVRMLHLFLGENAFREGVSSYLERFKYDNVDKDDLWKSLTKTAHWKKILPPEITVKQVMDSWTVQNGYPLITVERNYCNNTAYVSQGCYTQVINKKWWVPLTYISNDNSTKNSYSTEWLRQINAVELKNMPACDNWVIFNVNMSGLYRVMYDTKNWELIIKALKRPSHDGIPTLNRLQLIVDTMDFAWSGRLNYTLALKLLQYIDTESEFLPWEGAIMKLNSLNSVFKRTSHYGVFKKYMKNIITPIFDKFGGLHDEKIHTNITINSVFLHKLISEWAFRLDLPKCRTKALELFSEWMKQENSDDTNNIPSDLRSQVYCIGVQKGDEAVWEFMWQKYKNTSVDNEKDRLLISLTCTSELWLIKRLLEWSISGKKHIRQSDAVRIFYKIASNELGYYLAKNFLFERISDIRKYFNGNPSTVGYYIQALTNQIISKTELNELLEWVKENHEHLVDAKNLIQHSIEYAEVRIDWKNTHLDYLAKVLRNITE